MSGKVPPALLFSGTRGTGKTTSARIFAAALNCENSKDGDACGTCIQCVSVQSGNSDSVMEVDAASTGGVDDVRKIISDCHYSHTAEWRVVILDEAHSMSKEAYNALLKLLEEPPAKTIFVLVTTEPDKILGTVISRAMPFEFRRIKDSDVVDRLRYISKAEGMEVEDELLFEISKSAQGGLRDAVMIFDQVSRIGVSTASDFRAVFGVQDYSVAIMWSALRGDHAEGYNLVHDHFSRTGEAAGMVANLSRLVTELLVIKSEGRPPNYSEAALSERVEMANAVTTEALVKVCEILWELRSRARATETDQRSSMEMGFALIANSLRPAFKVENSVQPVADTSTKPSATMTLEEIASFGG